jgi:hypothetical protein
MIRQVAAGADSPLVVNHHDPVAHVAISLLSSHRRQFLFDLPALSSTSVGQGAQLIAGAVGNLMDQQQHFHDADTARWAETAKTPETLLGSSVQILVHLAQVDSPLDLTEFWQEASRVQKTQQHNILQRALDKVMAICVPSGNRTHTILVMPPSLAKTILTLEFCMTNPDDLSSHRHSAVHPGPDNSHRTAAGPRTYPHL